MLGAILPTYKVVDLGCTTIGASFETTPAGSLVSFLPLVLAATSR